MYIKFGYVRRIKTEWEILTFSFMKLDFQYRGDRQVKWPFLEWMERTPPISMHGTCDINTANEPSFLLWDICHQNKHKIFFFLWFAAIFFPHIVRHFPAASLGKSRRFLYLPSINIIAPLKKKLIMICPWWAFYLSFFPFSIFFFFFTVVEAKYWFINTHTRDKRERERESLIFFSFSTQITCKLLNVINGKFLIFKFFFFSGVYFWVGN